MSNKKAKKVRKQIKSLIESRTMDEQNKVTFSLQQLETFVQLTIFLTGKKPEKLTLVETFYNWYVQEVQRQAEAMGLKPGFQNDVPTFLGITVEKAVPVVGHKIAN